MTGSRQMNLLFALWDGGGNVPPITAVIRRMAQRGHRIRATGHLSIQAQIESAGARFVPYRHAPPHEAGDPAKDSIRTWQAWTSLGYLQRMRDRLMFGPAAAYAQDLLDEMGRSPADAVIADFLLPGALLAAESRAVPAAALVHTVYTLPAPGVPPVGRGYHPAQNRVEKARDAFLKGIVSALFNRRLGNLNQVRRGLGLEEIGDAMDIYRRIHRVWVMTYQAFDFPAAAYPPNTLFVGPQPPIESHRQSLDHKTPEDGVRRRRCGLDDGPPLVVATFSSNFARQEPLVRKTVAALAELPIRAVVTAPVVEIGRIAARPNVQLHRFVPHEELFPKASLVVTHGGHGTVIKALGWGIPIICLPCDHDQFDIAARVAWRGAGITLSRHAGIGRLRGAVREVLGDDRYRRAALRLARAFEAESHGSVVAEIEALADVQ